MDSVVHARSLGVAAEGVRDQYADGKAAKVWEVFIGDKKRRQQNYKDFLVGLLRDKGCKRILDVACGTGVDSIMLLEEDFEVVSVDASDKMLKYALKSRWDRRKERAFDNWIIEEANWLSLTEDVENFIGDGFDAVICLGNSFAHLLDTFGDQREQRQAISNFKNCLKPGGCLLVDHRNYDEILKTGATSPQGVYYNSNNIKSITTSVMITEGKANMIILDYALSLDKDKFNDTDGTFRLSYYPQRLDTFSHLLSNVFGKESKHTIFGDFKPLTDKEVPKFYIHLIEKPNVQ